MLSINFNYLCFWQKNIRLAQYIENYLELGCCKRNYAWKINSINNILKEFEQFIGKKIYTDSFSIVLCEQLLKFLQERGLMQNSIRDIALKLQAMLNRAHSEDYKIKNYLKHIMPAYTITQQVYLVKEELKALYDLKDLTLQLKIIRDTFLLACYTGLRLSDLITLNSFHIVQNHIIKIMRKTGGPVCIPLHPVALEILNKYNNQIPKIKTIQYYNRGIKKLCEMAGITQPVTREYIKGGITMCKTVPKCELVSSHTGRRTAITNLYLEKKMDIIALQKFSGHASIENLLLYIKASASEYLKIMSETDYFSETPQPVFAHKQTSIKHYIHNTKHLLKMMIKRSA